MHDYTHNLVADNTYEVTTTINNKEYVFKCIVTNNESELDELVNTYVDFITKPISAYTLSYADLRRNAYPAIADQLDTLYHGGYDAWRAQVNAVKQQYPKPQGATT